MKTTAMTRGALPVLYLLIFLIASPQPAIATGANLAGAWKVATHFGDKTKLPYTDIYVFGDSLSDSGNVFCMLGEVEPPSPPYFDGRHSDGKVWVESLSLLLDLDIDFETDVCTDQLANNQAIGGAFTGFGSHFDAPFGILSQVENFMAAGGSFDRNDLVVLWGGSNDYFFTDRKPWTVVRDLIEAIESLATIGGKRFLIANLPNLGDTPGGSMISEHLNYLTATHNALLTHAVSKLRAKRRLDIVLLDVNKTFAQMLDNPEVFGFDKERVAFPCLIQQPDGTREPSNLCAEAEDGETYDSTGVLFWDLVHPTAATHRQIAIVAHTTLVAAQNKRRMAKITNKYGHDDVDPDD